jgi:hypothetical protein
MSKIQNHFPFLGAFSFLAFLSYLGNEMAFEAFLCLLFVILPDFLFLDTDEVLAVTPSTSISKKVMKQLANGSEIAP